MTYTHDLWNRLVKATYGSDVRGEYVYNALHWRIMKRADTNPETSIGLDEQRVMFCSPPGRSQLLEERIDDGRSSGGPGSVDRISQNGQYEMVTVASFPRGTKW